MWPILLSVWNVVYFLVCVTKANDCPRIWEHFCMHLQICLCFVFCMYLGICTCFGISMCFGICICFVSGGHSNYTYCMYLITFIFPLDKDLKHTATTLHRNGLKTRWKLWMTKSKSKSQSCRKFVAGFEKGGSQMIPHTT